MLDKDLAEMHGVETKQLKRQVRRNTERCPRDFMFKLTPKEFENLRSQIGTSSWRHKVYADGFYGTRSGYAVQRAQYLHRQGLSLNKLSELFGRNKLIISRHLKNIYKEEELDYSSSVAKRR